MHRGFRVRLLVGVLAIVVLAVTGYYGYEVGLSRGLAWGFAQGAAQSVAQAGTEAGRAPIVPFAPYGPWGYGPGPWGYGYHWGFYPGFFPFLPLLVILFWVLVFRGLFWRARWGHGRHWGYREEYRDRTSL